MSDDVKSLISEIEDLLFPQRGMDVYERSLYYHLIRHTQLIGRESRLFSLPALAAAIGVSETKVRETIRSLESKGCVELERSQRGHLVHVRTPEDLGLALPETAEEIPDLEALDFYSGRRYVDALLAREDDRCFYCLAALKADSCVLDHVRSQADGGGNSYRNIVAACHSCNSKKQGVVAEDYLRILYRQSLLSEAEFASRLEALEAIREGRLIPEW